MNEEEKKAHEGAMAKLMAEAKAVLADKGPDAAIEFIEGQDDFKATVNTYNGIIGDLYWKQKELKAVVPIANAGVSYCLEKSRDFTEENPELATNLKAVAKAISFNLASFTWPGWDEKGITITPADLDAGLAAAELNLKLVEELGADPAQMSNSYWSLGAHYLARNTPADYQNAKEAFAKAKEHGIKAGKKDSELMNEGYIAMAKLLVGEDARDRFDAARTALAELGTDDAKFYAEQLESVLGVFTRLSEN